MYVGDALALVLQQGQREAFDLRPPYLEELKIIADISAYPQHYENGRRVLQDVGRFEAFRRGLNRFCGIPPEISKIPTLIVSPSLLVADHSWYEARTENLVVDTE